jgi:hypothetical protein
LDVAAAARQKQPRGENRNTGESQHTPIISFELRLAFAAAQRRRR